MSRNGLVQVHISDQMSQNKLCQIFLFHENKSEFWSLAAINLFLFFIIQFEKKSNNKKSSSSERNEAIIQCQTFFMCILLKVKTFLNEGQYFCNSLYLIILRTLNMLHHVQNLALLHIVVFFFFLFLILSVSLKVKIFSDHLLFFFSLLFIYQSTHPLSMLQYF